MCGRELDLRAQAPNLRFRLQHEFDLAPPLKALFFDVFGTLVDWRGGVAREAERMLGPRGHLLDWGDFADAWRGEYQAGMEPIRSGQAPFVTLDVIHRRNLDRIL